MILEAVRDLNGRIADFRWSFVSDEAAEIFGRPVEWFKSRSLLGGIPEVRSSGRFEKYVRVVEAGEPLSHEISYRFADGERLFRLIAAKAGDGLSVFFRDLTERHRAEEELRLRAERYRFALQAAGGVGTWDWRVAEDRVFADESYAEIFGLKVEDTAQGVPLSSYVAAIHAAELGHRIRNIFAVVGGLLSLAARERPQAADFAREMRQRFNALAIAHDHVRPDTAQDHAAGMTIRRLLGRLLEPYSPKDDGRIQVAGNDTELEPGAATSLALIIHELATNSVKYGSLSSMSGTLRITGKNEGEFFSLVWKEHCPIVVQPPREEGFGSVLIERAAALQLQGDLERHWEEDGLRVLIRVPTTSLGRSPDR